MLTLDFYGVCDGGIRRNGDLFVMFCGFFLARFMLHHIHVSCQNLSFISIPIVIFRQVTQLTTRRMTEYALDFAVNTFHLPFPAVGSYLQAHRTCALVLGLPAELSTLIFSFLSPAALNASLVCISKMEIDDYE